MPLDTWILYAFAAIGLSLTPGPNGLLSLTHGMRYGLGHAVYTVLGGIAGFLVLIAVSMAGMGALLAASEQAFTIAKWLGAGYLVYLGIRTWRAPPPQVHLSGDRTQREVAANWRLFTQGFLVATSNPKALIFFAAFLPQFIDPSAPFLLQFVLLGGTFALVEFVYELILAGTAQRIAPWLGVHGRWFNRAAGATFIGIGGVLTTVSRI
ncbi:MAG: LysE family translocator [Gammaproteobacteria bacterium]|nr:MAG: LysE family translocator [Gammaproteobacteria bacterium]